MQVRKLASYQVGEFIATDCCDLFFYLKVQWLKNYSVNKLNELFAYTESRQESRIT